LNRFLGYQAMFFRAQLELSGSPQQARKRFGPQVQDDARQLRRFPGRSGTTVVSFFDEGEVLE